MLARAISCVRHCARSPAARPRWLSIGAGDAADDRLAMVMADVKRQLDARAVVAADVAVDAPAAVPGVRTPGDKMVLGFTCSYADSPIAAETDKLKETIGDKAGDKVKDAVGGIGKLFGK